MGLRREGPFPHRSRFSHAHAYLPFHSSGSLPSSSFNLLPSSSFHYNCILPFCFYLFCFAFAFSNPSYSFPGIWFESYLIFLFFLPLVCSVSSLEHLFFRDFPVFLNLFLYSFVIFGLLAVVSVSFLLLLLFFLFFCFLIFVSFLVSV